MIWAGNSECRAARRRQSAAILALFLALGACAAPSIPDRASQFTPLPTQTLSPQPAVDPSPSPPGASALALIGATLVDGTGAAPVPDSVVVLLGARIVAAGPRTGVAIPPDARQIDLSGATILPGFINAHIHGGFYEAVLEAWARGGVTTVRDLAVFTLTPDWALRDRSHSRPRRARLVAAGPMITVSDGYPIAYWGGIGLTVSSAHDASLKAAGLLDDGADLLKIALESGAIFGQKMPMLSPDEAAAVVRTAHSRGRPVSAHVTVAADLLRALDAGVDDIAHMATDRVPDDVIRRMVDAGVYWVPTLELWQGVGLRSPAIADNLRRFVAAGGKIALGTDYEGAPDVDFDLGMPVTEIELMAQAGMTPMQIVVAATRHAAHVCGLEQELGTVEPGKIADLLVVAGNPLADLHALAQPRLVVRDGVVISQ
jgi:imidazolonepropionase-like amidohydrolase